MPQQTELLYLRRNPFIKALLPLILGIISYSYIDISTIVSLSGLALSFIFLLLILIKKQYLQSYKRNHIFGIVFSTFILFFSLTYCYLHENYSTPSYIKEYHSNSIIKGVISESILEKNKSFGTTITIKKVINGKTEKEVYGKINCYFPKNETPPKLGDVLLFKPRLNEIKQPRYPDEFDYKEYLKSKGIVHSIFLTSNQYQKINETSTLFLTAEKIRASIVQQLEKTKLKENEIALIAALFLGDKKLLNSDIKTNFSDIGAMHVLAVSGLHVGILLLIITFVLNKLFGKDKRKALKVIITLLLIWSFAFITGLSVSVLRASLMFSLIVIGKLILEKSSIYNTISASAFIILIYNPVLLFDVGFQLSYLAVLGIIYFYPKINNLFYIKNKIGKYLWNITAVSIAAQIATIPLSIYYFHQIPLLSLVSNIIVSVYAVVIISGGVIILLVLPFSELLNYIAIVMSFIISSLLKVVEFLATIPYGKIDNLSISNNELYGLILLIILSIFVIETKRLRYINYGLILVLILLINKHFYDYELKKQHKITFINLENEVGINLTSKSENLFYTTENENLKQKYLSKSLSNFWVKHTNKNVAYKELNKFKNQIIEFGNTKVLIVNTPTFKTNDLWFDYIYINNKNCNLNYINDLNITNTIIVNNTFSTEVKYHLKNSTSRVFFAKDNPSFDL